MFDFLYQKRLKQDLERWVEAGWVTPSGAGEILADQATGDDRSRLPMALAGIGVVCVALALAAFIAANWDGIPRTAKLIGIATLIIGSHMLAAFAASRGRRGMADLATAFATLVFVGGMALVGQIFHLPADWAGGAVLVCLGALAAAWLTGSRTALIVAALAAISWQTGRAEPGDAATIEGVIGLMLLIAIVLHPVRYPLRVSRWAAILLFLVTYGRWIADGVGANDIGDDTTLAMVLVGFAAFAAVMIQVGAVGDLFVKWSSDYPDRRHGRWLMLMSMQDFGMAILSAILVASLLLSGDMEAGSLGAGVLQAPVVLITGLAVVLCAAGFILSFKTAKARALFGAVALGGGAVVLALAFANIVITAALVFAALIAISLLGTLYRNHVWTLCGYGGLTAAALWLLYETVGSLLGQAVFFFVAGLMLLGLAYVATRLLRRGKGAGNPPPAGPVQAGEGRS